MALCPAPGCPLGDKKRILLRETARDRRPVDRAIATWSTLVLDVDRWALAVAVRLVPSPRERPD